MYVRLVQFILGPGARSTAEKLADEFVPAIRAQHGCNTCKFISDDENGDYGIVVLWDSKEDANAAAAAISPRLTLELVYNRHWLKLLKRHRPYDCMEHTTV